MKAYGLPSRLGIFLELWDLATREVGDARTPSVAGFGHPRGHQDGGNQFRDGLTRSEPWKLYQ